MSADCRPLAQDVATDAAIAAHFSTRAEIEAIVTFEAALAETQAALGMIPEAAGHAIAATARSFEPPLDSIRVGFAQDGVPIPALVRDLRRAVGEPYAADLHKGATSQDAVDTGLMLRLHPVFALLDAALARLIAQMDTLVVEQGTTSLMAQTRMQAALPFTVAEKIATWIRPLAAHRLRLQALNASRPIQLGGPIGTGSSFGDGYPELRAALASRLGLTDVPPWHADRTPILEIAQGLMLLTGTLGKIGQDVALMAQTEIGAVRLAGGGRSSAMAHKQNPVGAELLVALGRLNAGRSGVLAQAMIHENERSGAAWTLEWLVLPDMASTTGAALRHANALLVGMEFRAA